MTRPFAQMTAEEAASLIRHGETIGFSGFSPAGAPKAIPKAIAERAAFAHQAGQPFQIGVITGASTGPSLDGVLARSDAIAFRTPYQADPDLRQRIRQGCTRYFDMHLSHLPQAVRYGFLGKLPWAIIEACDLTQQGEIVLTSSVGASPTFVHVADRILIELNHHHPAALRGFHDIFEPADPPHRREISIYHPSDRIGAPVVKVDPNKIVGVVETNLPDETAGFDESSEVTRKIGEHVAEFLATELRQGRIPPGFLPIQSGVGDIANAVLAAMGTHPEIPDFAMYSEVIQDAVIHLIRAGRIRFASAVSLTVSPPVLQEIYGDLEYFRPTIVLRPQEIANHPEVIRRLGVISINTAIEVDLFGHVNSSHVMGLQIMNGIGGSGDFTRNAYISIFTTPSIAKGGKISAIVPKVSHTDHSEHSVQVLVTENGVADLRGRCPDERAHLIIENCAHPQFRGDLHTFWETIAEGPTPASLGAMYAMHQQYLNTGDMRGVDFHALVHGQC